MCNQSNELFDFQIDINIKASRFQDMSIKLLKSIIINILIISKTPLYNSI